MRAKLLLTLLILPLAIPPAHAGKNADGALIVHTTGMYGYRYHGCDSGCDDPGTCKNAGTGVEPGFQVGRVIGFLAAFPDNAELGVSSISFGVRHNYPLGKGWVDFWGLCLAPPGSTEDPHPSSPDHWQTAGNRVTFGEPISGDRLFSFLFVRTFGAEGPFFGTGPHPNAPTAEDLHYPGSMLAYVLNGLRPLDPLARMRGDELSIDWLIFRLRRDERIPVEELERVIDADDAYSSKLKVDSE